MRSALGTAGVAAPGTTTPTAMAGTTISMTASAYARGHEIEHRHQHDHRASPKRRKAK